MERRDFLGAAAASAPFLAMTGSAAHGDHHRKSGGSRQYYELLRYELESDKDRELVDGYLREAAIPAYNRLGVKPVGAFEPVEGSDDAGKPLYVLLPYPSLEKMVEVRQKMPRDKQYRQAAEAYLGTPKNNPAYDRITSSLMIAFSGFPQLQVPKQKKRGEDRLFELRTYESHNEHKARLKVEMFNKAEIELFDSLGFSTVFYGDTLVGDRLPNLTYMLVYDDREQRDRLWKKFFESDGWQKLKNKDRYANTVSKVHNWFLEPTGYSQL